MRVVVAISGASGAALGLKAAKLLQNECQVKLILSDGAKKVLSHESDLEHFDDADLAAPVSSGSYKTDAMMVAPCSMNTLAKIACGIADTLITRAAAVHIKEGRRLLLAPRELPFGAIALENMLKLSRLGVIIAPPVMAYYSQQQTLEQMEEFVIGKWFDLLGIENSLYKRWGDDE